MTVQNPAVFLQAGSHPAEDVRRFIAGAVPFPGVVLTNDLKVTEKSGTANMSVDVAGGRAFIAGSEATYQGTYFVENRGTENLVISAADATNPRIDLIVAKVQDAGYSGATNAWSLAVVAGTPAAVPAAPTAPANSLVLARVAVAALATSVVNANITDYRYITSGQSIATAAGGTIICRSDTRPTTPNRGTVIYETDTGKNLVYYGATTGWQPPWNLPWGIMGRVDMSASQNFTTLADITQLNLSVAAKANRRWRIHARIYVFSSIGGDFAQAYITDASNITLVLGTARSDTNAYAMHIDLVRDVATSLSTINYKVRATRIAGTGTFTCYYDTNQVGYLMFEDIGPSASSSAPTD
jgi:hypothetical protein